jgi:hypothetical protein
MLIRGEIRSDVETPGEARERPCVDIGRSHSPYGSERQARCPDSRRTNQPLRYAAHSLATSTSVRTSVTESRCETDERIARMTGGTVRSELRPSGGY